MQAIARQYANALFAVASRNGRTAVVGQDLSAFATLVTSTPDLHNALNAVGVPMRRKRAAIDALVAAWPDGADEVKRLLTLLADRDRLSLIQEVSAAFDDRVREADRVIVAEVTTAVEIPADRQEALEAALSRATGRRVTVNGTVDESILGGVVARVGGLVFDGSVASQLEKLRQRLAAET